MHISFWHIVHPTFLTAVSQSSKSWEMELRSKLREVAGEGFEGCAAVKELPCSSSSMSSVVCSDDSLLFVQCSLFRFRDSWDVTDNLFSDWLDWSALPELTERNWAHSEVVPNENRLSLTRRMKDHVNRTPNTTKNHLSQDVALIVTKYRFTLLALRGHTFFLDETVSHEIESDSWITHVEW